MLSAVKNFAITLIVSLLVFGTIAFFVAPAIEQGMTMGGKSTESTDDSGESKLPDGYVYVTDDSGATVTDANGNPITEPAPTNGEDVKGKSFNILLLGNDYQPDVLTDYNLSGMNAEIDGFKIKERTINVDTIILIRVDKEKGQLIFLTIPSNTQVYVSGGNTTLSALYSKYGLDYLCHVYDKGMIVVVEIMGRHAGWLAAASALASEYGAGPDLIYLPETDFSMPKFIEDVKKVYNATGNCIVAVSEGIHYEDGGFVSEAKVAANDGFGHAQLGGLATILAEVLKEETGAKVRGIELNLLQRCAAHLASETDIEESYMAGKVAVENAVNGINGRMIGFERGIQNGKYACRTKLVPLVEVANVEKKIPREWINEEGNGVNHQFIEYALPLIQGEPELPKQDSLPRFVKLKKVLAK